MTTRSNERVWRCHALRTTVWRSARFDEHAPGVHGAYARSRPRNGSSRIARAAFGRSVARANRTRCPSPPETNPPLSPSLVCKPAGDSPGPIAAARCRVQRDIAASVYLRRKRYSAKRLSFQIWIAGSTQAHGARICSTFRGSPSTRTSPEETGSQPSSKETRLDLPAPEGPTIAMCSPG